MNLTIKPLPRAEAMRRLKLVVDFLANQPEPTPFIAGRNVDRTYVPEEMLQPAVEDTMQPCGICGDGAWYGPKLMRAVGVRVCFLCAAFISNVVHGTTTIPVDPDAAQRPRRRT